MVKYGEKSETWQLKENMYIIHNCVKNKAYFYPFITKPVQANPEKTATTNHTLLKVPKVNVRSVSETCKDIMQTMVGTVLTVQTIT